MARLVENTYADDAPSLREIARALEAADVPTPAARYEWHPTTVARALAHLGAAPDVPATLPRKAVPLRAEV